MKVPSAILLVEDNPGDARLLREYLREANLLSPEFVHVSRLTDARAHLERHTPDLILLDLSLPDAHGLSTVTQMLEASGDVPIIVLTGLDDENVALQAVQLGAQDYLIKGQVEPGLLGRSIRYAIERKQLDRERNRSLRREQEARTRAESAVRARDEILRIVSHDLGNPISGVLINTSVLLRTIPPGDPLAEVRQRVEEIRDMMKQMQRLRQDLLDVSVIEAGQLSVLRENIHASSLVTTALERVRPIAAERSVSVEAGPEPGELLVSADRERILQVLDNLLGNAVKFTPAGSTIAASASAHPAGVCFTVVDEGPGIPAEHLERIFDRFWKVDQRSRTGAGLGLAICMGIVEAHGGRIWVESEVGIGSRFHFVIPAAHDPSP
jgi:signal transduction histidine kinase